MKPTPLIRLILLAAFMLATPQPSQAGWMDFANEALQKAPAILENSKNALGKPASPLANLTQEEIIKGIKEALATGFQQAAMKLGQKGGFLKDTKIKIPMPGNLAHVESALRAANQDKIADQFVETMNRAAEKATPITAGIFSKAIKTLTLKDAQAILQGEKDAATQYLKKSSSNKLANAIKPIVKESTDSVGLTASYKTLIGTVGNHFTSLNTLIGQESLDLDQYITNKTMDGLFIKLAEEEAKIRDNPAARTTSLLQKVFSAVK